MSLMRFRYILLIAFCCCFILKVNGQDIFSVRGAIHRKGTPERVGQVLITNLRTKQIMMADNMGTFQIAAAPGDTLLLKKIQYTTQMFVITSTSDVVIYLQPEVLLKEVTIKEQTKKQEMNDILGLYKQQGGYSTLKPSTFAMIQSPLTGLYELFGQEPNRARKFQEQNKDELERIEVNKRYNKELIKKVTGLTDDKEIASFLMIFTPLYQDIKTWSDYEVVNYVKISYDWYKKHKDELKGPSLF